jgi:hypothetical protein
MLKSLILSEMPEINRQELIESYLDRVLDNMSTKDLLRIVGDQLEENLSSYSDEELINEVMEYYPDLLGIED